MAYTPSAIIVFGISGQIHIGYPVLLAAGQAIGAHVGAGVTLTKGEKIIRPILTLVVLAAAAKLVFF